MDTSHVNLSVNRPPCVRSYQIEFSSFRGWLICNLGRAQCARYSLEFLNIYINTTILHPSKQYSERAPTSTFSSLTVPTWDFMFYEWVSEQVVST